MIFSYFLSVSSSSYSSLAHEVESYFYRNTATNLYTAPDPYFGIYNIVLGTLRPYTPYMARLFYTRASIDTGTYFPSIHKISVRASCQYLRERTHQKQHKRAKQYMLQEKRKGGSFIKHDSLQSGALRERAEFRKQKHSDYKQSSIYQRISAST